MGKDAGDFHGRTLSDRVGALKALKREARFGFSGFGFRVHHSSFVIRSSITLQRFNASTLQRSNLPHLSLVRRHRLDQTANPMIRAFMLIFDGSGTWEKIDQEKQPVGRIFFQFVLPLLLLTSVVEGWGLMRLGEDRGREVDKRVLIQQEVVVRYELTQIALSLLIVFGGAVALKQIGASFHRRHSYTECFTTLAYSLSPLYLVRLLDAVPVINTWVCWGIGALLMIALLYGGIPHVMKPDPSNALGLYMFCSILLMAVTGLAHFVAILVLEEKFLTNGFS